ncbi:M48 family metallopeptidase [Vibrio litoralis]|uniref:M48 family metallopeptidase n=1 Tax=Vibrio litoralis TaxID=335972 RepID=UPI000417F37A|nr:SprT family zinc-dependent metalloprotease [Vibrio litoralis]
MNKPLINEKTANAEQADLIEGQGYQVHIVRTSRRKTASVKVEDGVVSIVVPKSLAHERIQSLVEAKHQWIVEKLAIYQASQPASEKHYVSGEAFPYLGRNYRLKVLQGELKGAKLLNGRMTVTVPEPETQRHYVRKSLENWYLRQAQKKIREKVERYRTVIGVETGVIRIKEFKSRWGSCTSYGDLEFNWLIVMAPNRIVDYVVIHELCHLIHHDHSPSFWKEVERVMPDYREHKAWLKEHGHRLVF